MLFTLHTNTVAKHGRQPLILLSSKRFSTKKFTYLKEKKGAPYATPTLLKLYILLLDSYKINADKKGIISIRGIYLKNCAP
jgi:hypothetical protein